jgi:uncharacterized membrane protein
MRNLFLAGALFTLVGLVGCDKGTPGGPGADKDSKIKLADDSFNLSVPNTKLKQGETQDVVIGISRGKNFQEDVVLVFDDLPTGVSAEPASPTIKPGDSKVTVKLKAKDDAALGDHAFKVKGKPSKGKESTNEAKVTVNKK